MRAGIAKTGPPFIAGRQVEWVDAFEQILGQTDACNMDMEVGERMAGAFAHDRRSKHPCESGHATSPNTAMLSISSRACSSSAARA